MLDITNIVSDYLLIPVVLLALITGYILKHAISDETFENRWIPVFVTIEGIIVSVIITVCGNPLVDANTILQAVVAGGISGAASSGLYDAFAAFLKDNNINIDVIELSGSDDTSDDSSEE
jgi:uncharacterized membrane protein